MLPTSSQEALKQQLARSELQHRQDLAKGAGWVELPFALNRKYPNAGQEWAWQWVFPATRQYKDKESGQVRRHHLHETVVQRAVRNASREIRLPKRVSCHSLRHSFATHLLEGGLGVRSPLDHSFPNIDLDEDPKP